MSAPEKKNGVLDILSNPFIGIPAFAFLAFPFIAGTGGGVSPAACSPSFPPPMESRGAPRMPMTPEEIRWQLDAWECPEHEE